MYAQVFSWSLLIANTGDFRSKKGEAEMVSASLAVSCLKPGGLNNLERFNQDTAIIDTDSGQAQN